MQRVKRGLTLSISMEHSMRAVIRTVALVVFLAASGSGPWAGQANAQGYGQGNPPPPPPPQAAPAPNQYSSNEIVDTGHRFFGTVARGLAQIVERAGSQWGLPNGYILGQEAGGAVVAGLRYGEGT